MDVTTWLLEADPAVRWQTMRDLLDAPVEQWEAERSRVAHEGFGARLLALQEPDGSWAGGAFWPSDFSEEKYHQEGQAWTATFHSLVQLRDFGVVASDPVVEAAMDRVETGPLWEEGDQHFFDGEVEPCINGRTVAVGTYFGRDMTPVVERLLGERLGDGGWNCRAPEHSSVTSFDTTINVMDGLAEYRRVHPDPRVDEAIDAALEYLLERRLYRRLSTGEPADPDYLKLSYPHHWHYDVLRALEWMAANGVEPDGRCDEALAHVRSRRTEDGRWLLERLYRGRVHFPVDAGVGEPSHWLTLKALRVLRWAEAHGR